MKILVMFLCLSVCFQIYANERSVSKTLITDMAESWINKTDEYFYTSDASYVINGKNFGMFTAGIKGLLLYSPVMETIAAHLQLSEEVIASRDFYDMSFIKRLSGLDLYTFQPDNGDHDTHYWNRNDFNYINPSIVKWGHSNLIPDPEESVYDVKFSEVYDKMFSRFFRLMAESYIHLSTQVDYNKACADYKLSMKKKDFDALEYLDSNYSDVLKKYEIQGNGWSEFTPPMAMGFWLRRGIDGSHIELWKGMNKFMFLYDRQWFVSVSSKIKVKQNKSGKK